MKAQTDLCVRLCMCMCVCEREGYIYIYIYKQAGRQTEMRLPLSLRNKMIGRFGSAGRRVFVWVLWHINL